METIGDRARAAITNSGMSQAEVAVATRLTESQLSKSLKGIRQFSAVELAGLSQTIHVSLQWLITGEEGPMAVRIAARHAFNGDSQTYSADGAQSDMQTLQNIALLYCQAYA